MRRMLCLILIGAVVALAGCAASGTGDSPMLTFGWKVDTTLRIGVQDLRGVWTAQAGDANLPEMPEGQQPNGDVEADDETPD